MLFSQLLLSPGQSQSLHPQAGFLTFLKSIVLLSGVNQKDLHQKCCQQQAYRSRLHYYSPPLSGLAYYQTQTR